MIGAFATFPSAERHSHPAAHDSVPPTSEHADEHFAARSRASFVEATTGNAMHASATLRNCPAEHVGGTYGMAKMIFAPCADDEEEERDDAGRAQEGARSHDPPSPPKICEMNPNGDGSQTQRVGAASHSTLLSTTGHGPHCFASDTVDDAVPSDDEEGTGSAGVDDGDAASQRSGVHAFSMRAMPPSATQSNGAARKHRPLLQQAFVAVAVACADDELDVVGDELTDDEDEEDDFTDDGELPAHATAPSAEAVTTVTAPAPTPCDRMIIAPFTTGLADGTHAEARTVPETLIVTTPSTWVVGKTHVSSWPFSTATLEHPCGTAESARWRETATRKSRAPPDVVGATYRAPMRFAVRTNRTLWPVLYGPAGTVDWESSQPGHGTSKPAATAELLALTSSNCDGAETNARLPGTVDARVQAWVNSRTRNVKTSGSDPRAGTARFAHVR